VGEGGSVGGGDSFVAVMGGGEGSWLLLVACRRLWYGGDPGGGKAIL
jgi:hypothetical protein